jgi:single-stranded DNA-binding protein
VEYYTCVIEAARASGTIDRIPLMVTEAMAKRIKDAYAPGKTLVVEGAVRVYKRLEGFPRTQFVVKVYEMCVKDEHDISSYLTNNETSLFGIVTKPSPGKYTALRGRVLSGITVSCYTQDTQRTSVHCLCWGTNSGIADRLNAGDYVQAQGRLQSREFVKDGATYTAYELSVRDLRVPQETAHEAAV